MNYVVTFVLVIKALWPWCASLPPWHDSFCNLTRARDGQRHHLMQVYLHGILLQTHYTCRDLIWVAYSLNLQIHSLIFIFVINFQLLQFAKVLLHMRNHLFQGDIEWFTLQKYYYFIAVNKQARHKLSTSLSIINTSNLEDPSDTWLSMDDSHGTKQNESCCLCHHNYQSWCVMGSLMALFAYASCLCVVCLYSEALACQSFVAQISRTNIWNALTGTHIFPCCDCKDKSHIRVVTIWDTFSNTQNT